MFEARQYSTIIATTSTITIRTLTRRDSLSRECAQSLRSALIEIHSCEIEGFNLSNVLDERVTPAVDFAASYEVNESRAIAANVVAAGRD